MNLYKFITIIFFVLSLAIVGYIAYTALNKSKQSIGQEFFADSNVKYVNYYFKREEFKYLFRADKLVMERMNGSSVEFKKDDLLNKFLNNWSEYNGRLYPNSECNYLRISIPYGIKDLTQGGIMFKCVSSYINDKLNTYGE